MEALQHYIDKVLETDGFDVDGVEFHNIPRATRPNSIIVPHSIDDNEVVACAEYVVNQHNKHHHSASRLHLDSILKVTLQSTILGRHYRITFRAGSGSSGDLETTYQTLVVADWPRKGVERKLKIWFLRPLCYVAERRKKKKTAAEKRKFGNCDIRQPTRASPRLMKMKMKMAADDQNRARTEAFMQTSRSVNLF